MRRRKLDLIESQASYIFKLQVVLASATGIDPLPRRSSPLLSSPMVVITSSLPALLDFTSWLTRSFSSCPECAQVANWQWPLEANGVHDLNEE